MLSGKAVGQNDVSETSLEDMFGLGNDQLRELMEQELPVPREDLVTGNIFINLRVTLRRPIKMPKSSLLFQAKN